MMLKGEVVLFAHPAVCEMVEMLVFSPKDNKEPLASLDVDAFNPIPLPLIAYVGTAVSFFLPYRRVL